jgi:hypothetical protein
MADRIRAAIRTKRVKDDVRAEITLSGVRHVIKQRWDAHESELTNHDAALQALLVKIGRSTMMRWLEASLPDGSYVWVDTGKTFV